ncbi:MAG: ABC transporter permease, partial [Terriglobia bacterium]
METLWQDLKYGARMLAKSPGFTAVAVLTLALGIGANTAIFSVVNAILLKPLPFQQPDQLVYIQETARRETVESRPLSYPNFLDWRARSKSFSGMAALDSAAYTLTGSEQAERITGEGVSAGYFDLLGSRPILGRAFAPEEDQGSTGERVAIISHNLWQRRFGTNPEVIGELITLNNHGYTIVGVAPAGFHGLNDDTEVWIPFTADPDTAGLRARRGSRWHEALGRLHPTVSL